MIIYIDMDGVLVDSIPEFCKAHKKPWPYDNYKNYGKFKIEDIWGMSNDEFYAPLTYDFWLNCPKTAEVDTLLELTKHHERYVLSSPSSNPKSGAIMEGKRDWLFKNIPELANNFIFTKHKGAVAGRNKLLIDDADKFIDSWKAYGGIGLLMPRVWNSRFGEDNLLSFYNELTEVLK